jgi:hypothetical protein
MKPKTAKTRMLASVRLYGKSLEVFSKPEDGDQIKVWALLNGYGKGEEIVTGQRRAEDWARNYLRDHLGPLMDGWQQGLNG